jgi:hypothetical protein
MLTNAVRLAPLLNRYLVQAGSPTTIVIPQASQLARIQETTVRGILLKNQMINWDPRTLRRRVALGKRGGRYALEANGSLAFCVGVKELQPHVVCRIQDAAAWLLCVNQSIGKRVSVGGFLRCSFGRAGLTSSDNVHIFEIHPVCAVEIGGELCSCELTVPVSTVQDWASELNRLDERRQVRYWEGSDMLVFSNVEPEEEQYVRLAGQASDITLNISTNHPAWFILKSSDVARQVKVTCLQGTRAAHQLRNLNSPRVTVVGLRSIDLARAMEERYRINLLVIDIQPA